MLSGSVALTADRFQSGSLSDGAFEGKIDFVQTANVITVEFKIENDIPAYIAGQQFPRIVMIMPKGMVESPYFTSGAITNLDGSIP